VLILLFLWTQPIYWFGYGVPIWPLFLWWFPISLYYNYALYCKCWEPPILSSGMLTSDRVFPGNTLFHIFVGHSLGLWLGINFFIWFNMRKIMRYYLCRKSLTCYIALLYLFDNKNKHLVVWDLSYGHSDYVTYGKESHPVFPGATKTRDPGPGIGLLLMLLYKKYLMIPLHNLCKYHCNRKWSASTHMHDIMNAWKSSNPHLCSHFHENKRFNIHFENKFNFHNFSIYAMS